MLSDIWWPPCGMQRRGDQPCSLSIVQRAQVLDQPVGERAVELQPVAVAAHAAVADQVAGILHREQVLAGRHRLRVVLRQLGLQREVERVAGFLVPEQAVGLERLGVGDARSRRSKRPLASTASRLPAPTTSSTASMRRRSSASDAPPIFILTTRVAEVEVAAHLVLQRRQVLAGVVVAAGGVDEDLVVGPSAVVALGEQRGRAACPRSWRRRPTPPCRSRRPRPSARRARPASRSPSSTPRCGAGRGCRRRRSTSDAGSASMQARDEALAQQPAAARSGRWS